jgi:hypothetical protein
MRAHVSDPDPQFALLILILIKLVIFTKIFHFWKKIFRPVILHVGAVARNKMFCIVII